MNRICDLHSHSNRSDGSLSPSELVKLAEKQGLSALALTDHNTSKGLKEFMEAGRNSSVITVPGCEFTTEWREMEIHIVGLFFKEQYWPEIEDFLEIAQMAKANSNRALIENLNKAGYEITEEEVAALTDGAYNRSHVARVLMNKGYVSSVKEAFGDLLKAGNGFYTPAKRLNSLAVIRFIKVFGATAIMAHPLLNLSPQELTEFLPEALEVGLDAIETLYTEFTEEQTGIAISLAEQFGLKQSGGSDFHGTSKPNIFLGTGYGNLQIPYQFYLDMLGCSNYEEK